MLRIGHRGAAALAPENTIAAMQAAIGAGVDMV
jgi:glycerophosphoryl diester phosphodiesterase